MFRAPQKHQNRCRNIRSLRSIHNSHKQQLKFNRYAKNVVADGRKGVKFLNFHNFVCLTEKPNTKWFTKR